MYSPAYPLKSHPSKKPSWADVPKRDVKKLLTPVQETFMFLQLWALAIRVDIWVDTLSGFIVPETESPTGCLASEREQGPPSQGSGLLACIIPRTCFSTLYRLTKLTPSLIRFFSHCSSSRATANSMRTFTVHCSSHLEGKQSLHLTSVFSKDGTN